MQDESHILNDSSSISNLDVPINQLINEGATFVTEDLTSDNETPSGDGVQCFQIHDSYDRAVCLMFTKMSAHKGIKLFGERAVAAMMKELKQLNDGIIPGNPVIQQIPFDELSQKDKEQTLKAVNIIAQKQSGKIKGRTCVNGSRQRKYLKYEKILLHPRRLWN